VFENRVLRRLFGPKRDEVTGEWRKLHNEELHVLYSSPSIIRIIKARRMRWAGHVARMGEKMNAYKLLVGKPEGRRPLGRPRRRWLDNIRMDLIKVGWGDVDWIGLAQDRDRGSSCEFGIEPSGSIKCWETIECPKYIHESCGVQTQSHINKPAMDSNRNLIMTLQLPDGCLTPKQTGRHTFGRNVTLNLTL
jgi:hypothetical protein